MIKKLLIGLILISLIAPASVGAVKEFQVDTGSTLTTGLLGYWKMEDATEFFNGYTVVNNGSVAFSAGKVNDAGDFVTGDSDFLSTDDSGLDTYTDFSLAFWIKMPNVTVADLFISKAPITGSNESWYLQNNAIAGKLRVGVSANGTSFPDYVDITHGLTNNTWQNIVVTYRGSDGLIILYNNTNNQGNDGGPSGINNSTQRLEIGGASGISDFYTGSFDEVGFWSKILSSTEIDDLYNSGSGQTMVEVADDSGVGRSRAGNRFIGTGISR